MPYSRNPFDLSIFFRFVVSLDCCFVMDAGNLSSGSPKRQKRSSSEVNDKVLGIVLTYFTVLAIAIMNTPEKDWCGEVASMVISMLCGLMAMLIGLMILDSTIEVDDVLGEQLVGLESATDADEGNKSPIIPLFSILVEKMVDDIKSVSVSKKWQAHLNSLEVIKVCSPAIPKQLLPEKDVGAVNLFNAHSVTKLRKDVRSLPTIPTATQSRKLSGPPPLLRVSTQMPPFHHSQLHVQYGGLNPQMQSQGMTPRVYIQQFTRKAAANTPEKVTGSSCLPSIDKKDPPRDNGNMASKPSNVTFGSFLTAAFPAIDDDKVAKGATVGKIGFIKEIKAHGKRLSLVVKSKRKSKNIDSRHEKTVSAEGAAKAVQSAFVRPTLTLKGGESIGSEKWQEQEKQSSCPVMERVKKSENMESRRKHNKTIKIPCVVLAKGYAKVVEPSLVRPILTSKDGKWIESRRRQAKCYVECKETLKNIDSRQREVVGKDKRTSKNVVPAQSVVRSSCLRPTLIRKDDKPVELGRRHRLQGHEKRLTPVVEESKRKSENMDVARKKDRKILPPPKIDTKAAGIKLSLRKPPIPSARKPARHAELLADSRKTTSKIPGPAAASTSTQRSHTTVMPRWK